MFNIIDNYIDTRTFEFPKMDSRFRLPPLFVCVPCVYIVQRFECISLAHCFVSRSISLSRSFLFLILIFDILFLWCFFFSNIFVIFIRVYFHLFFPFIPSSFASWSYNAAHTYAVCVRAHILEVHDAFHICIYMLSEHEPNARIAVTGSMNHSNYLSNFVGMCRVCVNTSKLKMKLISVSILKPLRCSNEIEMSESTSTFKVSDKFWTTSFADVILQLQKRLLSSDASMYMYNGYISII